MLREDLIDNVDDEEPETEQYEIRGQLQFKKLLKETKLLTQLDLIQMATANVKQFGIETVFEFIE